MKRKAIMLSVGLAVLLALPTMMSAQSDREGSLFGSQTIKQNSTGLMNPQGDRGAFSLETTTQQFGESAPLGSGLLFMMAAGAGYAVARRKRNKKSMALLLTFVMVLGFTQCKKNDEPAASIGNGNWIHFELIVNDKNNDNARHTVDPDERTYSFVNGDIVYIGDGSQYLGPLTYNNGTFSGNILEPSEGTYLHVYYLGGLETSPSTLTAGTTTTCTVNISDQRNKLPVLSYGKTTTAYSKTTNTYSCFLENKCALVKFPLNNAISSTAVGIGGMLTEATINFATPGITPTGTTGTVRLYSASATEKWAILLPQEAVDNASVYVVDDVENCKVNVPEIPTNGYVTDIPTIELKVLDLANISSSNKTANNGWVIIGETSNTTNVVTIVADAKVALDNVTINGSSSNSRAGIKCNGNATIILNGTNSVNACGDNYSGIFIQNGYTLTINGTGSLDVRSNGAAGIGGRKKPSVIAGGDIVINGGTIYATGGGNGAGIGCCYNTSCGNIVINGGTIIATGSENAAGIGGSTYSTCGDITINGGNITATGVANAAGIGSGYISSYCGEVTITSGVTSVTATKGSSGLCSIGKGSSVNEGHSTETQSHCGTVTIGGTVYWDGSAYQNGGDTYLTTSPLIYPAQ